MMNLQKCKICSICREEVDLLSIKLSTCNHTFHQKCLFPWMMKGKNTCPYCRSHFPGSGSITSGSTSPRELWEAESEVEDLKDMISRKDEIISQMNASHSRLVTKLREDLRVSAAQWDKFTNYRKRRRCE